MPHEPQKEVPNFRSWPLSSVAVMQQIGSDRRESGHRADIVNRSKMTHLRHRLCIAAVETLMILCGGAGYTATIVEPNG